MIAQGHRATEPTGEDMLSLISIESREKEVTAWLEDFTSAGREAGAEILRLYGPTEYGADAAKIPELELGNATINGLTVDQAQGVGVTGPAQNQEAEQGMRDDAR